MTRQQIPLPPTKKFDFGGGLPRQFTQRRHVIAALVFSVCLIAATLLVLPLSKIILSQTSWYMPATVAVTSFAKGLAALIFLLQFRRTGRWGLALISVAFLFSAVAAAVQLMLFPGVFSPSGWFGASAQSSPWMWVFAHVGFLVPVFMAAFAVPWAPAAHSRRAVIAVGCVLLSLAATALLLLLATRFVHQMPDLLSGTRYKNLGQGPAGICVWLSGWVTLIALWWGTRLRNRLQIWVAANVLTYLCETSLVLAAVSRFSVGWYFSGLMNLLATALLVIALVVELDDLYGSANAANDELHELSIRDSLTGAFVRRYLNEQLSIETGRARRLNQPLSILLIDVDLFKSYNDRFGHQAGDDCLVKVCNAAQRHLRRHGDFLARYGGEEFAVVLPNTGLAAAETVANRILGEVAALRIYPRSMDEPAPVTVSIGVGSIDPESKMDERSVIEAADVALYAAKHAGRNRVVVSGQSLQSAQPVRSAQSTTV